MPTWGAAKIVEDFYNFLRTSPAASAYFTAMVQTPRTLSGEKRLTPEATFVVQLRSDSNVPDQDLRGRVEHVMSGESEQFASLAQLLAFMGRYRPAGDNADEESTNRE